MPLNQSRRLIRMTKGPLGPDEVVVTSFSGREAISRPFDFEIEFISTRLDLRPGAIIGKELTIELDRRDKDSGPLAPRYVHGYVNRFAAGEVVFKDPGEHKYRHYRAGLVPWLWFLTKAARCYLFFPEKEDKSIFEVIEAVFDRAKSDLHVNPVSDLKGIGDLRSRKVKHCVQYRETDFNFVSRTMEQYGVFYYFKFEDGKHTLGTGHEEELPRMRGSGGEVSERAGWAADRRPHHRLAARLPVRLGQVVAHRLQLRDAVHVAQGERSQVARCRPAAMREV